jgi:hypothetical protein
MFLPMVSRQKYRIPVIVVMTLSMLRPLPAGSIGSCTRRIAKASVVRITKVFFAFIEPSKLNLACNMTLAIEAL